MTDLPDLYAFVIRLRPVRGGGPLAQGHGAQALFLDLVRQVAPDLAARLDVDAAAKPYTVAVVPDQGPRGMPPSHAVDLRVTLLRTDLFAPFTHALIQQTPEPLVRLGDAVLHHGDVLGTPWSHPWAGYGTFADLRERREPAPLVVLEFVTATALDQGTRADGRARQSLLPVPETLFPAIARRWNELAPAGLEVPVETVEQAARETLVGHYDLRSTQISLSKGPQKGFVGRCEYDLPADAEQVRLLALLAEAVFYLGVGIETACGMGLCRPVTG